MEYGFSIVDRFQPNVKETPIFQIRNETPDNLIETTNVVNTHDNRLYNEKLVYDKSKKKNEQNEQQMMNGEKREKKTTD